MELLKKELSYQKELIELAGGVVPMANDYPSPYEITEGIKDLSSVDLSVATATEEDVVVGKTFFSGTPELKTGTSIINPDMINHLFMYKFKEKETDETIYYQVKEGQAVIPRYKLYQNYNPINFRFCADTTTIEDYAFYETANINFENFEGMTKLKTIGIYVFAYSSGAGIDFSQLPNTLKNLGTASFLGVVPECLDYCLPASITSMGQMVFKQNTKFLANNLDLSQFTYTSIPYYTFQNVSFSCDIVFPSTIKSLGNYCFYGGGCRNLTIPANVTTLNNECFGELSSTPISDCILRTVVFESETPPNINNKVFPAQLVGNGLKIYVPDNALETYKAVANLERYVTCIYPMSEKE